jgi:hypothetical protein
MPTTRTPVPPTPDERVYTALFLLTLALRPLPDDASLTGVQIDRAALARMASEAGAPLGKTRFHAAVRSLAEDADDGWGFLVFVSRQAQNRQSVRVEQVAADPEGWDEALSTVGLTLHTATKAAQLLGLDTASPLPADVLQPLPVYEDDEAAEVLEKTCTHCQESKPLTAFPWKGVDYDPAEDDDADGEPEHDEERPTVRRRRTRRRPASWCRTCTAAASKAAADRRRPAGPRLPAPADRQTSATAKATGEKVCTGCGRRLTLRAFHRDSSRGDGHAVRCRQCRSEAAHDAALRRFTDF